MADNKNDFFSEEEQKAQEEIEKIKLGDQEYDPKELESYIEKGKKVDEYTKKYNTDFDKAWSSYGKTTQENKALKEQLEEIKSQQQKQQIASPGDLNDEQIAIAREQARKIGIVTQGDLDTFYSQRRSAEKLLEECSALEGEIDGTDGRPKFNSEEILQHMTETGIKNPIKAYKDKYESEIDAWKSSELNKSKGQPMPTITNMNPAKAPAPIKVTKDNLSKLVNEELWGNQE